MQPLAFLSSTLLERDDLEGAARAVDSVPEIPGDGARFLLCARGEVLLAQRRVREALAAAERLAGMPLPLSLIHI